MSYPHWKILKIAFEFFITEWYHFFEAICENRKHSIQTSCYRFVTFNLSLDGATEQRITRHVQDSGWQVKNPPQAENNIVDFSFLESKNAHYLINDKLSLEPAVARD